MHMHMLGISKGVGARVARAVRVAHLSKLHEDSPEVAESKPNVLWLLGQLRPRLLEKVGKPTWKWLPVVRDSNR
jgi:hypothetical protein